MYPQHIVSLKVLILPPVVLISVSVCQSVCLSAVRLHVQISRNFLYMLPVAIAWSFSDVCAVLCTSSFVDDVVERMDQNEI